MEGRFRPLRTWFPCGIVLVNALLVFLLTTEPIRSWIPTDSRGIVVSFRENSFLLGLVGAFTGFSVGRLFLPDSVVLGRSSTRHPRVLGRVLIVPVCAAQISGYLTGILGALAMVRFDRGGEVVVPFLAVCLGLLSLTAWGFLIGSTLHSNIGTFAVVMTVVLFVYSPLVVNSYFLPGTRVSARALGMVWAINEPSADLTFSYTGEIARVLFYLMILAVGALLFVWSFRAKSSSRIERSVAVPMIAAIVTISGVGALFTPPQFAKDDSTIPCETSGNVKVCQYAAYQRLVPKVTSIGQRFSQVVPGAISAKPVTEYDESAVPIPHPHGTEEEWTRATSQSFADFLSGATVCINNRAGGAEVPEEALLRAFDLSAELMRRTGAEGEGQGSPDSAFSQQLRGMSSQEFSDWFDENASDIRTCAIAG